MLRFMSITLLFVVYWHHLSFVLCFFPDSILKKLLTIYFLIYFVALGLCCCVQAFSSCGEQGLLFIMVHRLLIVVASLVAEHRLQDVWASKVAAHEFSSCGTRTWLPTECGIFPDQGSNPCPCIGRQILIHTREVPRQILDWVFSIPIYLVCWPVLLFSGYFI